MASPTACNADKSPALPAWCRVLDAALLTLALVSSAGVALAAKDAAGAAPVTLVDINSASREQLKSLPGIGDAEAARIVSGRPYLSKADLASRKVIPTGTYLSLKDRIVAIQVPMERTRRR
jgi:DNA uptake protein ComE-like DNA-binding protein